MIFRGDRIALENFDICDAGTVNGLIKNKETAINKFILVNSDGRLKANGK